MRKYRTTALLLGVLFVLFISVNGGAGAQERSKRQAPNINVHQIPKTGFSCEGRKQGDYYADPETNCQVYHVCVPGMYNKMALISFVCPNGTIFSQASRVCTPYDRVDCKLATKFYDSVHGSFNNGGPTYNGDTDFDNYVPQPPRAAAPPPPRQQSSSRQQPPAQSSRNTIPPPPPPQQAPAPPQRSPSRFRTGTSQFRQPQSPPQTPAAATPAPAPARQPARQPAPAFRPPIPVPGARPAPAVVRPVVQTTTAAPARPTVRAVVSTSTSGYNYEYEYEYDYEDETPAEQPAAGRRKRDASAAYIDYYEGREDLDLEREPKDTKFSCKDKVAGAVYADIETDCEMFHICIPLSKLKMVDYKLYCANGRAFDQETGTCKEKFEFKCERAQSFYQFDKLNQSMLGKKPIYKKSSYTKSKKASMSHKE